MADGSHRRSRGNELRNEGDVEADTMRVARQDAFTTGPRRVERDSMGEVTVDESRLWGAQTQRSLENFAISEERMPLEVIHAFGTLKIACARVNHALGKISAENCALIVGAAEEVRDGTFDEHFPLKVWQTGSGTQTNMNVNEVISNRANEIVGQPRGSKTPVHPNDHVNCSQSSNDTFPTAMHLAAAEAVVARLLPQAEGLLATLRAKARKFAVVVKIGRTHLMDATPISVGQEFSGYATQVENGIRCVKAALPALYEVAIGGTAVGTGLNTHPQWSKMVAAELASLTGLPIVSAPNKFEAISAHDALVEMSSALKRLAVSLFKIGSDLRLSASGPRCGLQELTLPANEPGSSIMPGKVNPTQVEALTMACVQVIGNDTSITMAGTQGHFQLNVFKPVMIYNLLQSIRILGDVAGSFDVHCVRGVEVNKKVVRQNLHSSLMLVTALNQHIGYDKASIIAKKAYASGSSLREACVELGYMTGAAFDAAVDPVAMCNL